MVRTFAARSVGGFDETMRDGLEDWDFWLRLAKAGHWGGTIPEVLDHYRTREDHSDRWKNLGRSGRREFAEDQIRKRYRGLDEGVFAPKASTRLSPAEWREITRSYWPGPTIERKCIWMILPHLELGGADRLNLDLLTFWRARGFEVVVVTTRPVSDSWIQSFREKTSFIYSLPKFLPAAAYPAFLEMLVGARRPSAVYLSHSEVGYHLAGWLKKLVEPAPLVDLLHIVSKGWRNGGYPRMSVQARDFLDGTIVTSDWLRDWLCREGHDPERIHVAYTGIDPNHWVAPARGVGKCRLLFAARFADQKNPRLLPRIVRRLIQTGDCFELLVAGDGPDRPWLEDNLFKPFPQHVRYLGSVSAADMKGVMSACDVLLLPSVDEGIALVLFEAMSMELAVVATDVGGQRELVTEGSGVLIPLSSVWEDHFEDAVAALVADSERRLTLGRNARERILRHFKFEETAARMTGLLIEPPGSVHPIRLEESDLDRICEIIATLETDVADGDEWGRLARRRFSLVRFVSSLSRFARRVPLAGIAFRYVERRVGTRIGKWVLSFSRRG